VAIVPKAARTVADTPARRSTCDSRSLLRAPTAEAVIAAARMAGIAAASMVARAELQVIAAVEAGRPQATAVVVAGVPLLPATAEAVAIQAVVELHTVAADHPTAAEAVRTAAVAADMGGNPTLDSWPAY
jgi:hypothetical protein